MKQLSGLILKGKWKRTDEQGLKEFMENLNLSFEQLKNNNNFTGSLTLILLGKRRFNTGALKDVWLMCVSEHVHVSGHVGTTGLSNSKPSQIFRMSMRGSNYAIP